MSPHMVLTCSLEIVTVRPCAVIGESGLMDYRYQNEAWHTYYDIFVRHAFGSLRDVLLEVSYSPMMAVYLTFLGSRSFASSGTIPDENYAREMYVNPSCHAPSARIFHVYSRAQVGSLLRFLLVPIEFEPRFHRHSQNAALLHRLVATQCRWHPRAR